MHSYSVGEICHQQAERKIMCSVSLNNGERYKIDGFRWDLTRGLLKLSFRWLVVEELHGGKQQDESRCITKYADYSWNLEPYTLCYFEHLGANDENSNGPIID
jgi:pullulanase/glycogen debranching enzyme